MIISATKIYTQLKITRKIERDEDQNQEKTEMEMK